jgi:hypothetical protein
MSATLAVIADKGGPSWLSALQGLNPISPPVANKLESLVGGSSGQEGSDFAALAAILGLVTTSWAATDVLDSWSSPEGPEFSDSVGAALGIIAIIVAGAADALSSLAGTIVSVLFDGDSLIIDAYAIAKEGATPTNDVIFLIDAGALGLDLVALKSGV